MVRYRARHASQVYDCEVNEEYFQKMEDIKMKKFYGRHLMKYTGAI